MCGYADYNEQKLVGNMEAPTHLLESLSYLINGCGLQIKENCLLSLILNSSVPFLGDKYLHCNDISQSYYTILKGIKCSIVNNSWRCFKILL